MKATVQAYLEAAGFTHTELRTVEEASAPAASFCGFSSSIYRSINYTLHKASDLF